MKITVSTQVTAPVDEVWRAYTTPEDILVWNTASPDWHTTVASVDLRVGRALSSRMEAKDGPDGVKAAVTFDSESTHTEAQQRSGWQSILNNFARHVAARQG